MASAQEPKSVANASTEQESNTASRTVVDDANSLSVSSRQGIRAQMNADIEAFLAGGGKIKHLDITMSAEKLSQQ